MGIGVDVGAAWLHAVCLVDEGGARRVRSAAVVPADAPDRLVAWVFDQGGAAGRVAVDAPSGLSTVPHAGDTTLSPKFRVARCGEIALGRLTGTWVPWVSPPAESRAPAAGPVAQAGPVAAAGPGSVPPWMVVGLAVFAGLAAAGVEAVETFPHAAFKVLAGGRRPPAKSTAAGLAARAALLGHAGVVEPTLGLWGHDGLDAAVAALVAVDRSARGCTCGHDGSSIWVPAERAGDGGNAGITSPP